MTDTRTQGAVGGGATPPQRPAWRTRIQEKVSGTPAAGASPAGTETPVRPAARPHGAPQDSRPAPRPSGRPKPRGPRKARLRLTRIDPWSVMKTAFLLSIAFAVVTIVSVTIVWSVLGAAGVWDSVNSSVQQVVGGSDASSFDIQNYIGMSRVLGFTMLVSVVDVVLLTAVATLGAFLYNLSAALLGGIEVTLAEDGH